MSLSSHLEDRTSPVRQWFEARLPVPRSLIVATNRAARGRARECPRPSVPGSNPGLVGTAIDYVMRAFLLNDPFPRTAAATGAELLDRFNAADIDALCRGALEEIAAVRPWEQPPEGIVLATVCDACIVLASLEQAYRGGLPVLMAWKEWLDTADGDATALRALLASESTREDLVTLASACVPDHLWCRDCTTAYPNPQFALSIPLGGADADLVVDGQLIDFKTSKKATVIGTTEIRQLLGYALADTDDVYKIQRVSLSALRWGTHTSWPLTELLAELSGDPDPSLAAWREDFAAVVLSLPERLL
jgi:hypothetical protein